MAMWVAEKKSSAGKRHPMQNENEYKENVS
jgi:hypothetical protein